MRECRIVLVLLFWTAQLVAAPETDRTAQRQDFLAAESALAKGDLQRFRQLQAGLQSYPLLPYLQAAELERNLGQRKPAEIAAFLDAHEGTPFADALRADWLDLLAKRADWHEYARFYRQDRSTERRCHYLHALMQTGRADEALPQVAEVWLEGESQPKACDPVFSKWQRSSAFTPDLIWARIALAIENNELRLARYLGRQLPDLEQVWLERWINLRDRPRTALTLHEFSREHPYRNKMLAYAVARAARKDALEGLELWEKLKQRYQFAPLEAHLIERRLARSLLFSSEPEARALLTRIEACGHDIELIETLARSSLRQGDWPQVLELVERIDPADREDRWEYWRARAMEQTGRSQEARDVYRELARGRGYYAFLAADRIESAYQIAGMPTPENAATRQRIRNLPAMLRVEELQALDRQLQARREWRDATARMNRDELMSAALLASDWGWLDQAIFTLARSGYWEDLELRFPVTHLDSVAGAEQETGLDRAWILAVIRQESAFNKGARSRAGAMGLMQLMPATAKQVATRNLKEAPPNGSQIVDPRVNIRLGSTYLADVLGQLNNNPVLATAAYNAGPHRVQRWLPDETMEADIWVELIPFGETREYVKRVLSYRVIYDHRLGRDPRRLSGAMPPVVAAAASAGNKTGVRRSS